MVMRGMCVCLCPLRIMPFTDFVSTFSITGKKEVVADHRQVNLRCYCDKVLKIL